MSTSLTFPNYDSIVDDFKTHNIEGSPAEVHGIFCGLFCAQPDTLNYDSASNPETQQTKELHQLFDLTRQQFLNALEENALSINLLLPNDEAPLAERIAALGQWSQGFLSGLGEGGLNQAMIERADLQDVLKDIAHIADINSVEQLDVASLNEEDEKDYTEISSYLGVAVLSIHMDLLLLHKEDSLNDTGNTDEPNIIH